MSADELLIGSALAMALAAVGCVAVGVSPWRRDTIRFQLLLFLVSFGLRFTASLAIYNTGLGTALGDDDSSGWYGGALLESNWRMSGMGVLDLPALFVESFRGINRGYAYWLGAYFLVTGAPYRLTTAALSCLCGALTVVFVFRTALALRLTSRGSARVGWWTCVFPSMLVWSAQTVKEPIVMMLEVLSLYGCLRLRIDGFRPRHAWLCTLSIVLLTNLRFYAAYMAAAAILASLVLPRVGSRRVPIVSALFVAAVLAAVLTRIGAFSEHSAALETFATTERIQAFRQGMATTANTGFGAEIDTGTSNGLLLAVSTGWAFLLLAPFPWQLGGGSARLLLTLPEQFVWWVMFFTAVLPGTITVVRRRLGDVLPVVLFLVSLGLVYSVTITNVGTLYRERAQFLPYLFVFASLHLDERRERKALARMPGTPRATTRRLAT